MKKKATNTAMTVWGTKVVVHGHRFNSGKFAAIKSQDELHRCDQTARDAAA